MTSSNSPLATFSFPLLHLTASVLSFLKLHTDAFRDSYARKSFAEISCIRIGLLSNFLLLFIIICFFVLLLDIADLKKKAVVKVQHQVISQKDPWDLLFYQTQSKHVIT